MSVLLKGVLVNGLCLLLGVLPAGSLMSARASERLELEGYLDNKTAYSVDTSDHLGEFRNVIQVEGKLNIKDPGTFVKLIGRGQIETKLEPDEFEKLDLREAYLAHHARRFSLTLGRQQVVWGKADGFRILDRINPLELREFVLVPYTFSRIPLWLVNGEYFWGVGSLQGLVIPDIRQDDPADPGGRFFIPPPLPVARPFVTRGTDDPDSGNPGDWEYGVKWEGRWREASYTLNYFYTWNDNPVLFRELAPNGVVEVIPKIKRQSLLGASGDLPVGPVVARLEGFYTPDRFVLLSTPNGVGNFGGQQTLNFVVGFDWAVGRGLISPQVFHEAILDAGHELIEDKHSTLLTLLSRVSLLQDKLRLQLFLAYGANRGDAWIAPKIWYDLGKGLEVTLGGDFFTGDRDSLLGQFAEQDRMYLQTTWRFQTALL